MTSAEGPTRPSQPARGASVGGRTPTSGDHELLLRTAEVAAQLQVSARTVLAWAQAGKLPSVRTPSGHRRYPASAVAAAFEIMTSSGDQPMRAPIVAAGDQPPVGTAATAPAPSP